MFPCFIVPPPSVSISFNGGQCLSGGRLVLLCTINLLTAVNSQVSVVSLWFGPSGQLRNSTNIIISNTYEVTDGVFQNTLMISNFDTSVHNGDYVCNATVVPVPLHIIGVSAVGRRTVTISGSYFTQ